ncbi:ribosome biogenesis GTP-binding protein YlqF [Nitzschia inconspicua]|uniref:Ribosome biogenesis GTP-binding protein YlqF n=1 Tax=Nitzschia inconspicua TaxID=303405 RepID=A0A9K3M335_9STRA|nr:ribosome biogenesis GTP-binding protein YlqF [Nitzschia inconspicua]
MIPMKSIPSATSLRRYPISLSSLVARAGDTLLHKRPHHPGLTLSTHRSIASLSSSGSRNNTARISASSWEEQYHLGRSLSKSTVTAEQQKKWNQKVKKWKQEWDEVLPNQQEQVHYQGYEMDALEEIQKKSYEANLLLEIRDVRVPLSSHHPSFTRLARHRNHLICYTHADTIDAVTRDRVRLWTSKVWPDAKCLFIDTREMRKKEDVLPAFSFAYERLLRNLDAAGGINAALTVGMPNVGKSSLLLSLLKHAKTQEAIPKSTKMRTSNKSKSLRNVKQPIGIQDVPGKTRDITEYLIRQKPRAYFLDVPGMSPPAFFLNENPQSWFALGACNLVLLSRELEEDIAVHTSFCDYVLYAMNRDRNFQYVNKLGLDGPTQDIQEALEKLCRKNQDKWSEERLQKGRCEMFLKFFNTGNFGPVILDDLNYGLKDRKL